MQDFLFIRVDKKNIRVYYDEIIYLESVKNYVRIITTKRTFVLLNKLDQIENVLCPKQFFRIHCSYIISAKHIVAYDCNSVELVSKVTLPISRRYKTVLDKRATIWSGITKQPKVFKMDTNESQKN